MLKELNAQLLNIVFPPRCAGCKTWNETIFCSQCTGDLKAISAPMCFACGAPFDALAQVLPDSLCSECRDNRYHHAPILHQRRAPFEYSGPVRKAIHALKYQGKTALATPLAAMLSEYAADKANGLPLSEIQALVPIPLHPVRNWRRGYNQSLLLAQQLCHVTNIPCVELLRRTRHTVPQVELEADARTQNVKGAFTINERIWSQHATTRNVLLIDDVATTGATLEECARVLKKRGVTKVRALTLARID